MARKDSVIKSEIIAAFDDLEVVTVSKALDIAGVNYNTFYRLRESDSLFLGKVGACMLACRERRLDEAEDALRKNIKGGNNASIIFFLKTIGKQRGYSESLEINQTVTHEIDIKEAAKRIAFAMNSAIAAGQTIDGTFTDVIPKAAMKIDKPRDYNTARQDDIDVVKKHQRDEIRNKKIRANRREYAINKVKQGVTDDE